MSFLAREARASRQRRTALPLSSFMRHLTCTRCGALELVGEACQGAKTEAEHRWIEPEVFVGVCCLKDKTETAAARPTSRTASSQTTELEG